MTHTLIHDSLPLDDSYFADLRFSVSESPPGCTGCLRDRNEVWTTQCPTPWSCSYTRIS